MCMHLWNTTPWNQHTLTMDMGRIGLDLPRELQNQEPNSISSTEAFLSFHGIIWLPRRAGQLHKVDIAKISSPMAASYQYSMVPWFNKTQLWSVTRRCARFDVCKWFCIWIIIIVICAPKPIFKFNMFVPHSIEFFIAFYMDCILSLPLYDCFLLHLLLQYFSSCLHDYSSGSILL